MPEPIDVAQEVKSALNTNKAVVALESSVIAHGLPKDVNVKTALEMEDVIREAGAFPATIGIIDGQIKVGLSKEEIERLAEGNAAKVNAADVPYAVAKNLDAGTTVSATARIATALSIPIMATGGIGGVHRNYAQTLDISMDLWELAHNPIIIVCSGAKAVLDICATMEWLETHGVAVYGYNTDELPSFYSRKTGINIPKLDGKDDVVELLKLSRTAFPVRSSTIIANPIPESDELDVNSEIDKAAKEAEDNGIKGKELTPYLLNRVAELTRGKSIDANIALLKNNAMVAAEIAVAMLEEQRRRIGFVV